MQETVLYISDNMRCWNSAKPGFWKWGTYLGRITVTNQRLLFLSTGSSKMGSIITAGLIAGPLLGPLMIGKSLTSDLEIEALKNEGSFAVPINEINEIKAVRRWDLAAYLSIQLKDGGRSFMQDPFGMNLKVMKKIVETIEEEKTKMRQG